MDNSKLLSLYVHIPFCIKKCNYCDFLSFPCGCEEGYSEVDINKYVDALCKEVECEAFKYSQYEIHTIFLGGGTPSLLSSEQINKLFKSLHKFNIHNSEITIEANPGTITKEKAEKWKQLGINRISLGLQSADNEELSMLGRIHTWEDFLKSWEIITQAGFSNRNIDLISGLPGQARDDFKNTLQKVIALNPEHISAYSLQLEEGTKFYDRYTVDDLPSEDEDRKMYELTRQMLNNAGFKRYEISNYSKPGHESKHNLVYWQRGNYLGLGLGASSMVENVRFSNISELDRYCNLTWKLGDIDNRVDYQELSIQEQMEEFMFLGLRLMNGVSESDFYLLFERGINEVYGSILEKYMTSGHMRYRDGLYSLTEKGIDVSNVILADFLID